MYVSRMTRIQAGTQFYRHKKRKNVFLNKNILKAYNAMPLNSSVLNRDEKLNEDPFVLTGPIIGLVTDTTARILIETNVSCVVECKLNTAQRNSSETCNLFFQKLTPQCFKFENLQPDTHYSISLNIRCPGLIKAGFTTLPIGWSLRSTPARLAFIGGNSYTYARDVVPESVNLWKQLYKKAVRKEICYLIHLGDNVYVDASERPITGSLQVTTILETNRWQTALKRLRGVPSDQWPLHFNEICEMFRNSYRETWNHPMTKQTLANVPNLMILNEHEIHIGFGDSSKNQKFESAEFFLSCCAYEVYNEYQRNLFEDFQARPGFGCLEAITQAYHFHAIGEIGLICLDLRCFKTFHKKHNLKLTSKHLTLLGVRQMEEIQRELSDNGYFSNCRMLFVVSPIPLCTIGSNGAALKNKQTFLSSKPATKLTHQNVSEISQFLSLLFGWRAQKPGTREVCIVTGGVGQGCTTDVFDTRYGNLHDLRLDRLKQVLVAPIAASTLLTSTKQSLLQVREKVNRIPPYHQFKHYNFSPQSRQFAVIDVYLDYNENCPNYGIVTKFTVQVTGAAGNKVKSFKPIDNTFRTSAAFSGTLFACCNERGWD